MKRYFVEKLVRFIVLLPIVFMFSCVIAWVKYGILLFQHQNFIIFYTLGVPIVAVATLMVLDFAEISIKAWKLETKTIYVYRARYELGWNDKKIMGLGKFFENNFLAAVYSKAREDRK